MECTWESLAPHSIVQMIVQQWQVPGAQRAVCGRLMAAVHVQGQAQEHLPPCLSLMTQHMPQGEPCPFWQRLSMPHIPLVLTGSINSLFGWYGAESITEHHNNAAQKKTNAKYT